MPQRSNVSTVLKPLVGLLAIGVVMGLLMAGIAIPAVGAMGSATQNGVKAFKEMPSEFAISPLAQQSRILDAKGGLIANPYDENRIVVPLKQISPWMQKAQIAIEDSRFYEHGGLDARGFTRAALSNAQNGSTQGASSLTQQYVKVTLVNDARRRDDQAAEDAATEQSYRRKLQELKYALDVERNYTKDQILTGYLNLVYYGDQAYGVEAAAQNYFGTSAAKLDLNQSALLAGLVQMPHVFNPVTNPKGAQNRRNAVLDRMVAVGDITPAQAAAAKKVQVKDLLGNRKKPKGVCLRSSDPYFCAYMMEYLTNSPQMAVLGKTPQERLNNVKQGGLTIRTTLDPALQKKTLSELTKAVPTDNKQNLGGASTVIEPGTGRVLAMAQTTAFTKFQNNLNADKRYGGGPDGYQFGSSAKPYALVAALESGMPVNGSINAPKASPDQKYWFSPSQTRGPCGAGEGMKVQNDYVSGGRMSLRKAIAESINTAFVQLTLDVDPCKVQKVMLRMGMHNSSGKDPEPTLASLSLGATDVTPMTIAASYATFAARGKWCEPTPIASITSASGKAIAVPSTTCKQALKPEIADGMNDLLQGPLKGPMGTARGNWDVSKRPAAGKTGTTDRFNQSWFVGYTPQRSASVWIGNVVKKNEGGVPRTLKGKCFGEYGCPRGGVFGGTIAAPVWSKIMRAATNGLPVAKFTGPSSKIKEGDMVAIPNVSNDSISGAMAKVKAAGFKPVVGRKVSSSIQSGRVAGTSPNSKALRGSTVSLEISLGYIVKPKPTATPSGATPRPTAQPRRPTIRPFPKPRPTVRP